jgi:hypothetical protein
VPVLHRTTDSVSARLRLRCLAAWLAGAFLVSFAAHAQVLIDPWVVTIRPDDAEASFTWLDHTQRGLHSFIARSARTIDSWAGPPRPPEVYQEASGSIAVAVLWDEFRGIEPKVRFRLDFPLPQINERVHFFVGRLNRDEFVTERDDSSGAFPRFGRGFDDDDETLAGLAYLRPGSGGLDFGAGVGGRVQGGAFDPYVKADLTYRRALGSRTLVVWKETLFYQMSEEFGLTTRLDIERLIGDSWWSRWRVSATFSEETEGVRGFSTLTLVRALPDRRALAFRIGFEGDTAAEVPLEDFGVEAAFRRTVLRDWLVLELRSSLSWPKEERGAPRKPSWGFGIGCEMYFGGEEFSIQPITF